MSQKNKEQQIVELKIDSIGLEGVAVARLDNLVYFLKKAVPGDKVLAEVQRKRRNHAEAKVIEILEPSPNRIEAKCDHFVSCGGCSWQTLQYEQQLYWKRKHVQDAFERLGKVEYTSLAETLAAPKPFNYRNKMEFSFGASRWLESHEINTEIEAENKNFALGLHISGRYDKILEIKECHIQQEVGNKLLTLVRNKALELGVSAYHLKEHHGFLKNLIIRYAEAYDEYMIVSLSSTPTNDSEHEFIDWFEETLPKLLGVKASILIAYNDTVSPVAQGTIVKVNGKDYLTENILGIDFRISPFSFFQTNSSQLNNFVSKILEMADLKDTQTVWDLYCGAGTISLPASRKAKKVIGIELSESSINNARENATLNKITNVDFYCEDLHKKHIPELLDSLTKPDAAIIDPPRAGMHPDLVKTLLELEIPKLTYVSCNPATQARDCALLSEKYNVTELQPVDMFPQTYHVENIANLVLKEK
jgi:23S rRNA (uracil1939-C5)-methyltransferase